MSSFDCKVCNGMKWICTVIYSVDCRACNGMKWICIVISSVDIMFDIMLFFVQV